ncbi:MAG: class II glutamine amidotransferase [Chloroflexi bacterium]|nr:class II glutamine amidotransferase [Chloroflexota bacterium]
MCRWLVYKGPSIFMDTLLIKPQHSLIDQSMRAMMNYVPGVGNVTTNGDGFGLGWYGERPFPGLFRSIRPAWNDDNLRHLAAQIRSPLFFAHVRAAAPGTEVQRTNSHPFLYGQWLFQHNGSVGDFQRMRRDLQCAVAPELFPHIRGTTDSETLFYLALTYGLETNPLDALRQLIKKVEEVRQAHDVTTPAHLTLATTDGHTVYALRYSSHNQSKTLFYSRNLQAIRELDGDYEAMPPGSQILVSEPLDELSDNWAPVPEASFVIMRDGKVRCVPVNE